MVHELIQLFPEDPGTSGLIVAVIGSLLGAAIWLLGARISRPVVTLMTVLIGAAIGQAMPGWFGWEISGAGPAVGLALALGITGYALHGMWVGIGLGTVLSTWAALGCWVGFRGSTTWVWPPYDATTVLSEYVRSVWHALPPDVARVLPYACTTAMISGLAMAILWPRFSLLLGWSCAGATLLAGMGLAAVDYGQPEWIKRIPVESWVQAAMLGALVGVGMLIQWKLGPKPAAVKVSKGDEKPQE